ncbi:hypothetical protein M422DRAFT_266217 [Sphaerobolus stellatus SS14]|uniref:Uncharacterized protein n=1 Tax=Sphaerobolus stellatus (strain SS14) TaxID=990650 RepID=A0A0C9V3F5_SPHS4|nr:hypothetical protein M422DRAFT_266217 [Sphaerobolus stellatus SS14]
MTMLVPAWATAVDADKCTPWAASTPRTPIGTVTGTGSLRAHTPKLSWHAPSTFKNTLTITVQADIPVTPAIKEDMTHLVDGDAADRAGGRGLRGLWQLRIRPVPPQLHPCAQVRPNNTPLLADRDPLYNMQHNASATVQALEGQPSNHTPGISLIPPNVPPRQPTPMQVSQINLTQPNLITHGASPTSIHPFLQPEFVAASTPTVGSTVEARLEEEHKEAEKKAKGAEKKAKEVEKKAKEAEKKAEEAEEEAAWLEQVRKDWLVVSGQGKEKPASPAVSSPAACTPPAAAAGCSSLPCLLFQP